MTVFQDAAAGLLDDNGSENPAHTNATLPSLRARLDNVTGTINLTAHIRAAPVPGDKLTKFSTDCVRFENAPDTSRVEAGAIRLCRV